MRLVMHLTFTRAQLEAAAAAPPGSHWRAAFQASPAPDEDDRDPDDDDDDDEEDDEDDEDEEEDDDGSGGPLRSLALGRQGLL